VRQASAVRYKSVLAPVGLLLRQSHALTYQAGSDGASTTNRIGLEDGQHIGVAEIIQWLRAFSRKSPHLTNDAN